MPGGDHKPVKLLERLKGGEPIIVDPLHSAAADFGASPEEGEAAYEFEMRLLRDRLVNTSASIEESNRHLQRMQERVQNMRRMLLVNSATWFLLGGMVVFVLVRIFPQWFL